MADVPESGRPEWERQRDDFVRFLNAIHAGGISLKCEVCGANEWAFGGTFALPATAEGNLAMQSGALASVVLLACTRCANMKVFSWKMIRQRLAETGS